MSQKKAIKDCTIKEINSYISLRYDYEDYKILAVNLFIDNIIIVSIIDRKILQKIQKITPDDIICEYIHGEDIIEVE